MGMNSASVLFWPSLIVWALLVYFLVRASLIDLRERIIPNWIPLSIAALWLIWRITCGIALQQWEALLTGLSGGIVIGGGLTVFTLVFERITKTHAMGGGDLKLMASCALFLGLERGAICLLIACIAGIALAIIVPHTRFAQSNERTGAMPFGPAIALGTFVTLLWF